MSNLPAGAVSRLVVLLLLSVSAVSVGGSGFTGMSNSKIQQNSTVASSSVSTSTFPFVFPSSTSNVSTSTFPFVLPSISSTSNVSVSTTLQQVSVTIDSAPSGIGYVTVDGSPITTPTTFEWVVGSSHMLAATSGAIACGSGCRYGFLSWSDAGTASHMITVSVGTTSYTAAFEQDYYLTMAVNGTGGTVLPASAWDVAGDDVQVSASAAAGYVFASWTGSGPGSYTGQANPSTITMDGPINETATFAASSSVQKTTTATTISASTSSATAITSMVTVSSTATSQLTGPSFSLTVSPSSVWLPPGNFAGTTSFTLTLSSLGGWAGLVQFAGSALPATLTTSNLPQSYQLSSGGTASWNVQVNIGAGTQGGSYPLVITGMSGPLVSSAAVTINVESYPVTEFPESVMLLVVACTVLAAVVNRRRKRS